MAHLGAYVYIGINSHGGKDQIPLDLPFWYCLDPLNLTSLFRVCSPWVWLAYVIADDSWTPIQ